MSTYRLRALNLLGLLYKRSRLYVIQTCRSTKAIADLETNDLFTIEYKRNPWPWNENHEANKQADLEEVQFPPQGDG